jgi:hypothetical protein
MRQVRYRAVITLDPESDHRGTGHQAAPAAAAGELVPRPRGAAQGGPAQARRRYLNHTRDLMVRAPSLSAPPRSRSFPAEFCWDDELPLRPGDRHVVTITVTDDDAPAFFGAGQRFTLWDGREVGHGTISRQVFTDYGPS